jgi:hypothetical protein
MAGIKVTDLPVLGAAAADDVFYIVDTSTNTSSQIEVGDILSSADYTPTVSNESDCTVTVLRSLYSRVGNVVTISYYSQVSLDVGESTGSFNLSIPVASNFSNARDAFGVITPITDPYSDLVSAVTAADTAANEISITVIIATAGNAITVVSNIQYLVIP